MTGVYVLGTGMTPFGRFPEEDIRSLATVAVREAVIDAHVNVADIGMVYFANAVAGLISGQEMIRGQAALRYTGLLGTPIVNVENACASASTAFLLAVSAVSSGMTDVALAVGAEKLSHPDKKRSFNAIGSAVDLFEAEEIRERLDRTADAGGARSLFMDIYAAEAREYMKQAGAAAEDFAAVSVKSHAFGALNPLAQYRDPVTADQVMDSRMVADPLTLLMCSPIGDGAAAIVVGSADRARHRGGRMVHVRASVLVSGTDHPPGEPGTVPRAARQAYERAGIGPDELDVIEMHDAAAPAELIVSEELGLCEPGGGVDLFRSGATSPGGDHVVNPSGGLLSRGHPIGATGCAQIVELADQLRGRSGDRQVPGATVALAENAGGYLGPDNAATTVTILSI